MARQACPANRCRIVFKHLSVVVRRGISFICIFTRDRGLGGNFTAETATFDVVYRGGSHGHILWPRFFRDPGTAAIKRRSDIVLWGDRAGDGVGFAGRFEPAHAFNA